MAMLSAAHAAATKPSSAQLVAPTMVWRVPQPIKPGLVLLQPTCLESAVPLVPLAWEPPVGVAPPQTPAKLTPKSPSIMDPFATPAKPMSPSIMAPLMTPDVPRLTPVAPFAPRRGQRERRPRRHLPRGSKFPGGGQATPARKLVFVEEDDVDTAGLALLALARCA
jgi:hypothetical protein